MRGNRPLALGGVLVSWFWLFVWWAFVWFWGCLCSFPPHHVVFPSPSMMTWALRPHGVRTRGKKKPAACDHEGKATRYSCIPCCRGCDVDLEAMLLDSRAGPETLLRARSIDKGELRKEEGQNNENFSKRDRSQQTLGHVSEPFCTGTLFVFAYSEVA